jgi:alanyl-tRNA synthetase
LEVLVGGLELATLVFMDMERSKTGVIIKDECYTQMKKSIVDTGYGLERMVWAGNGMPTIYDAVMPDIVNYLIECTGLEHSLEDPYYSHILAQNARFAGMVDLNASNLLDLRKRVAKSIGIAVDDLVRIVEPIETLYTIADHSRCLVFMLGDGIVPSNVKAGYLARLVIRKVLRSLQGLDSAIPLEKIITKQIEGLNAFPKYAERVDTLIDIIQNETEKYRSTIDKGTRRVSGVAQRYKGQSFPVAEVIKMYDTYGVPPETVKDVAKEFGASVELPDDFYSLVAATHERVKEVEELAAEAVQSLPVTHRLFYDEPEQTNFKAHIVGLVDDGIILDKTLFYPGGGGQPEDTGYITAPSGKIVRVRLARLQGHAIIHEVEDVEPFSVGDQVTGGIDVKRRQSLARHHTATHILLASIRDELGGHIWQEGAQKGVKSSRLDVSHYKKVTDDERKEIELRANEMIMADTAVETQWMDRNEAEQTYGFALYQGGVPPGEIIRTVQVGDDVQACAGTHMTSTGKVGPLRIIRTERIQDGVERFEFAAGVAALKYDQRRDTILGESSQTLRVPAEQLPVTVGRFFEEWKKRGKANEECNAKFSSLASERTSIKKARDAILAGNLEKADNVLSSMDAVFVRLTSPATAVAAALAPSVLIVSKMKFDNEDIKILSWIIDADIKELLHSSKELLSDNAVVVLGGVREGQAHIVITMRTDVVKKGLNAAVIVKEVCKLLGGSGGGRPERAQGGGPYADKIDEAVNKAMKLVSDKLEEIGQAG